MKIVIITLNYNGKKETLEFLKSLEVLQPTTYDLKTIVVDNGSEDGSVSSIHNSFPKIDILQTGANLGYAGGFNKGINYGQIWGADYFLLVNNDCLIKDENLLHDLIKTVELNEKIGLVSPKIYFAKGFEFQKDRYTEKDLGNIIWFAGGRFDWDNIGSIHKGLDEVDKGQYNLIEEAEIFSGACVLIKQEVFEKIGLFDESYFLYFEDSEFAKRAKDTGFNIYYNGQVSIDHKVSQSTGIGSTLTDYYHTRNRLIFGMKYGKLRTKFALFRESFWLTLFGRRAQRRGILDYYLRVTSGSLYLYSRSADTKLEYPLKLSIGIVNYNTADLTKKLLESIFNKNSGFNKNTMEVIVLDNGGIDPAFDKIKEYLLRIKYLRNSENEGFSKAYNKTISYSLGEYYLMLNSDIEVLPDALTELVKRAEEFKSNAVLGGKLVFPDGDDQDSVFHLPTLSGAFKEYFLGQKGSYFMYLPKGNNPVKVDGLVMACLLIPKKILNKVGLLDEGTFIFFEDIEYARRLKSFNIPTYFVPTTKFIHHHGSSTKGVGLDKANSLLIKASKYYHGDFYYYLLTFILKIGQKLGRTKTPVSRWTKT